MASPFHAFVDTSSLVKRYVAEQGSKGLAEFLTQKSPRVFVSSLTFAEVLSTLSRLIHDGRLMRRNVDILREQFQRDWSHFQVIELTAGVREVIKGTSADVYLRGADLVQLASALAVKQHVAVDLFVASDNRLLNAATKYGLRVFDPAS